MKILITVKSLSNGGAERVASLWAKGFSDKGHTVSVFTMQKTEISYPLQDNVKHICCDVKGKPFIKQIKYIKRLREYVKSFNPDVVITVLNPSALYALIATMGLKIPIVNTEHNCFEWPQEEPMPLFEKFNKFIVNRWCNAVTVLTQADYNIARNHLSNVYVLPNPLSFNSCKYLPVRNQKKILSVGRLDSGFCKGFDLLIEAFSIVYKNHRDWCLEIAGDGSYDSLAKYQELVKNFEIEDVVHFSGFTSNILKKYHEVPIFVSASRYEGFGMAILEAMSQGCACVSTDYKGRQREIINSNSCGYICDNMTPESIAGGINYYIEYLKEREKVQKNAISRSNDFSLEIAVSNFEKIIYNNINKNYEK